MMAVPPHTGHTVHMFVLLLREMSEQENHFVLCGSILLNSNKTRHSQPQKNKSRYAAHPPLVWLSVDGFALSKSGLSWLCHAHIQLCALEASP